MTHRPDTPDQQARESEPKLHLLDDPRTTEFLWSLSRSTLLSPDVRGRCLAIAAATAQYQAITPDAERLAQAGIRAAELEREIERERKHAQMVQRAAGKALCEQQRYITELESALGLTESEDDDEDEPKVLFVFVADGANALALADASDLAVEILEARMK